MRLIFSFIFLFYSSISCACTCGPLKKITQSEIENVGEVFVGTIQSISRSDTSFYITATFEVHHYLKGKKHTSEISVKTMSCGSVCGLDFEVGQKWYVFAHYNGDELYAGLCGRSLQLRKFSSNEKRITIDRKYYFNRKNIYRNDKKKIRKFNRNKITIPYDK
jgi:hypothetical protein